VGSRPLKSWRKRELVQGERGERGDATCRPAPPRPHPSSFFSQPGSLHFSSYARLVREVETGTLASAEDAHASLLVALAAVEAVAAKAGGVARAAAAEREGHTGRLAAADAAAADARAAIDARRAELARAREARGQQEEYEGLKAGVAALPRRGETAAAAAKAAARGAALAADADAATATLAWRRRQFAVLDSCVAELTALYAEPDADVRGRGPPGGGGGEGGGVMMGGEGPDGAAGMAPAGDDDVESGEAPGLADDGEEDAMES